jgi:hypothetical protein
MRPNRGLLRVLIALLTLRVLAAPVAARPDAPKPTSQDRFIVRVCAWPARSTPVAQGATPSTWTGPAPVGRFVPAPGAHGPGPLTGALIGRVVLPALEHSSSVHPPDGARC